MNPENIILGERNQTQKATHCMIHLYEKSRLSKSIETEIMLVVTRGLDKGEMRDKVLNSYGVLFEE